MSDSQIEETKSRLNVVDVVGSYVKLTKTGANYRGACPFHSEKKPSFFVSPARQVWKCFGCGAGSSIFDFIMKIEGVEFGDALKILAAKAGVELKKENPKLRTERQRLYEICDLACSFFEKQLSASSWGNKARDYLIERGITEDSIKKWRLGYSPDTWQGLSDFLVGRGYTRQETISAGLAVKSDKGNNPYDRFRGRIIFPIFDLNSQVIGFGARVFKDADNKETAKYINTPQTLLYDKSNVLYGLNNAKLTIRKDNQCILTEGYTDTIMSHQTGFENTVSVSGTALTSRHLNLLKRYSDNLLLAFDMDLAGNTATKRGINLAESQGFNIRVIKSYDNAMPDGRQAKDPAEIILENPENWKGSVKNSKSIMDYYFDSSFASFDKTTPQGKKSIGQMVLPAIKRLPNKIEQSHWLQKLAQKLEVSQEAVLAELKAVKEENIYNGSEQTAKLTPNSSNQITAPEGRKTLLEEKIIALAVKDPENLNLIKDDHYVLFCDNTKKIIENIKKNDIKNNGLQAVFENLPPTTEYKELLDTLSLKAEVEYEEDGLEEIQLCLNQLKDINIRARRCRTSEEIKKAEQAGDNSKVESLIKEFNLIN